MEGDRKMLVRYLNDLEKIWGKDALTILLIKCGILMYPIIKENGGGLKRPLAIIVEDEEISDRVFHELSDFGNNEIITLGLPKKEFESKIMEIEYETVPLFCNDVSKHSCDNLMLLSNAMISGDIKGKEFNVLPVVTFVGGIPSGMTEYLSGKIVIEGKPTLKECANCQESIRKMIEVLICNMEIIQDRFK